MGRLLSLLRESRLAWEMPPLRNSIPQLPGQCRGGCCVGISCFHATTYIVTEEQKPIGSGGLARYTRGMSMAVAPRTIAVSERLLRREAVDNAITDLRLEGLAPSAQVRLALERFVQGDLSDEELLRSAFAG